MGSGYHGGFGNTKGNIFKSTIEYNSLYLRNKYKFNNGYFGERGRNVRVIKSNDPMKTAKEFYEEISKNGDEERLKNNHGIISTLKDGTRIVYREVTSTKDSPAIEISIYKQNSDIKPQKIHFIKGENNV